MEYKSSLSYLYSLQSHGIKLGLENINTISNQLGSPQTAYNAIHIAGTNGKGTVAKTMQTLLTAHGLRTGLFTSPHLTRFTERIQIDGIEITESDIVKLTAEIQDKISGLKHVSPTFFEFVTAMAFIYFKKMNVDWVVFETGLGGRFDSTNIINPKLCIITNINEDHKEFLGNTIKEIAFEKAGIIKPNVPVITMPQSDEAIEQITDRAASLNAPLYVYGRDFIAEDIVTSINGTKFTYSGRNSISINVPLIGIHQAQNIACAIKGFELLFNDLSNAQTALCGLKWSARYELVKYKDKSLLMDGAHNPAAIASLTQTLKDIFLRHFSDVILIIGIMSDKDKLKMLDNIVPICRHAIFTAPAYGRAERPHKLKEIAEKINLTNKIDFHVSTDSTDAMNIALKLSSPKSLILVTGSFYVIGEIRELMGEKTVLKDLAEVFKQTNIV
jgi:dihydrofolate synthase/folylpolyglutamate synthase